MFESWAGGPLDGDNVGGKFSEAAKKAGIGPFRFHDLRHTFASRLAMKGIGLIEIGRLLRHGKGSSAMTERYIKYHPKHLYETVELLSQTAEEWVRV